MYPETATSGTARAWTGVGNATIAPPPLGRVSEAHEATRKLLEGLQQEINLLENRLSPVLRPAGPTGATGGDKARNEPSPLGGSIEALNGQLYSLLGHVQAIAARVDL